jgi:uncharacterized protein YqhQ
VIKEEEVRPLKDKFPALGWPLVRGVVSFIISLSIGMKALMFSQSTRRRNIRASR